MAFRLARFVVIMLAALSPLAQLFGFAALIASVLVKKAKQRS